MLDTLIYSLITGIAVGFSAGYLGSIMVLEKMALVGDAMSHVALPGLALGVLLGFNPLLGGFMFLFISAVLIWHLGRVTKLSFETLVGAAFTLALAIGILLYGNNLDALEAALFGDITKVTLIYAVSAVAISIAIVFLNILRLQQNCAEPNLRGACEIQRSQYGAYKSSVPAPSVGHGSSRNSSDRDTSRRVLGCDACRSRANHKRKPIKIFQAKRSLWSGLCNLGNSPFSHSQRPSRTTHRYFWSSNFRNCVNLPISQENDGLKNNSLG